MAGPQTANVNSLPTADSLISMDPQERGKLLSNQDSAASLAQVIRANNYRFMTSSLRKYAVCPPVSGSGTNQTYAAGTPLSFNLPTISGAWAKTLIFRCKLTVNPATGTSATYALNWGAPLNVFSNLIVLFNGTQINVSPYALKFFRRMIRRNVPQNFGGTIVQTASNTGLYDNATVDGYFVTSMPLTVNTANAWNFYFEVPLNALHPDSPTGMLPLMGQGTQGQVILTCAPNSMGADAIQSPVATTGGTGAAVVIGGTVEVDVEYLDGTNYQQQKPLALISDGMPTCQYITDQPMSPLSAGTVNSQKLVTLLEHYYICSFVYDASQSTALLSSLGNLQILELDQDSARQNRFFALGTGNPVSLEAWYYEKRNVHGQDFDPGVIPWIAATARGVSNPDNFVGTHFLNCKANGWTDVHHSYQVGAVGSTGSGARVETFLISRNPAGLQVVNR